MFMSPYKINFPVSCPFTDTHAVPVVKEDDGRWRVHLGIKHNVPITLRNTNADHYTIYYSDNQLPEDMRLSVVMIAAIYSGGVGGVSTGGEFISFKELDSNGVSMYFRNMLPDCLSDLGWRVDGNWYYVIMSTDKLLELRGKQINGE